MLKSGKQAKGTAIMHVDGLVTVYILPSFFRPLPPPVSRSYQPPASCIQVREAWPCCFTIPFSSSYRVPAYLVPCPRSRTYRRHIMLFLCFCFTFLFLFSLHARTQRVRMAMYLCMHVRPRYCRGCINLKKTFLSVSVSVCVCVCA
jgi:hypothetical protein